MIIETTLELEGVTLDAVIVTNDRDKVIERVYIAGYEVSDLLDNPRIADILYDKVDVYMYNYQMEPGDEEI